MELFYRFSMPTFRFRHMVSVQTKHSFPIFAKSMSSPNQQFERPKEQEFVAGSRLTRPKRREGAAAVEAAFCFPIIILLMMGTLEICAGIYLQESVTVCAFEGARVGVHRGATPEDIIARVEQALADRQVIIPSDDPELGITVIPSDFSGLKALDPITVQVVAPTAGNSLYIFDSLVNRNVSASVTMVREFNN